MKLSVVILSLASLVFAASLRTFEQQPLPAAQSGFDLDLNAFRLIQLEGRAPEWIELKALGFKFFDITENQDLGNGIQSPTRVKSSFPSPNATEKVTPILKTLSTQGPKENLEKFTSFRTRLSADTTLAVSGADDDGSGSVTILEAYRALLAADYRPVRTLEFHWYSAEEGGLLGSQAVAQDYAANSVNVIAMSQFDMTAWVKRGTREEAGDYGFCIIIDYVDPDLTKFNMELVDLYMDIPFVQTQCGYACSDHASWRKAGYATHNPISLRRITESSFENSNKNIHSANDRIDISDEFSFEHMLEFSKLAVAFAVELGGYTD
ncbi:hypothetical protein HHX47_DHR5000377 [Lentinula edodes]|nr:hypothetical protein HHX47_DHR5000377 [Lentinula edodes]